MTEITLLVTVSIELGPSDRVAKRTMDSLRDCLHDCVEHLRDDLQEGIGKDVMVRGENDLGDAIGNPENGETCLHCDTLLTALGDCPKRSTHRPALFPLPPNVG